MAPRDVHVVLFLAALAGRVQGLEGVHIAVSVKDNGAIEKVPQTEEERLIRIKSINGATEAVVGGNGAIEKVPQTEDERLIRINGVDGATEAEPQTADESMIRMSGDVRLLTPGQQAQQEARSHIAGQQAQQAAILETTAQTDMKFTACTCTCKDCQPLPVPSEMKSSVLTVMGTVPAHIIKCGLMDEDEAGCTADESCQYNENGPSPSVQSRNPLSRFPKCHPTAELLSNSEASISKPALGSDIPKAITDNCGKLGEAHWLCSAADNDNMCDSFFKDATNNTMNSMTFFQTLTPATNGGTCDLTTRAACMAAAMTTEHCFFTVSEQCVSAEDQGSCHKMDRCEWDGTGQGGIGVCNVHPIEIFSVFYSESHKLPYLRALRMCADMPTCLGISEKAAAPRASMGSQLVGLILVLAFAFADR